MRDTDLKRESDLKRRFFETSLVGFLKGTVAGIITGTFLNFRYTHLNNLRFFPHKFSYILIWGCSGIFYNLEIERKNIRNELIVEEEIKRNLYLRGER
ncbi:hypothetical protein CLIB1444_01S16380 [[Candida] jaroonii]|uniref:Uncharacterized protein n=1 Tax=[Candida] jaroonii TaxID=467808 RepID=A0ACA9Y1P3_9ASCO|nr:hypothetical protein CLIB1444_01S16380 [[Candida] jaroonii]